MTLQISSLKREIDLPNLCLAVYGEVNERPNKPRLASARGFFYNLQQRDIPILVDVFQYWRDYSEFLLLQAENRVSSEKKFIVVKCSKRGNDVFAQRLDKRLGFLKTNELFFDPHLFDERKSHQVTTRLLWVTLTFDSKLCSLDDAWRHIGKEFNLWITNLRNKYGKVWYVAFPQAFPNQDGKGFGYPHLHLIMFFEDVDFHVFRRLEKDREGRLGFVYRIEEKKEIESQGKWHSFIDVKALSSMRSVWNYAKKHCYNAGYGSSDEASLNNAVMWLYGKKSFNMSGVFRRKYTEFIKTMRNSKVVGQKTLDNIFIPDWKFTLLGVFTLFDFCLLEDSLDWRFEVDSEVVHLLLSRFH